MRMNFIKTATRIFNKYKKPIMDHAPQILAGLGVACFVTGTVCAVKETPGAMEKLKEKEALDPEMTMLQKAAVIVPEYKKTELAVATGLVLTSVAWRWEAHKMAEALAALAAVTKDNDRLITAAKTVVGEEKTKEIVQKKEEILAQDYETEANCSIPSDQIPYLYKLPGGVKFWSTWAKFKTGMEYNRRILATNRNLSKYEALIELGADEGDLTQDMYNEVWDMEEQAEDYLTSDEVIDGAYELLDYKATPFNYGKGDNYITAWEIEWINPPKKRT